MSLRGEVVHLAEAPPRAGWRYAVRFLNPHDVAPTDHDQVERLVMDRLEEIVDEALPYALGRRVWQWQDPWVGVIYDTPQCPLPSHARMQPLLDELAWIKPQEIVEFGADGGVAADVRWWAPEVSAAMMGHPNGLSTVGRMLSALAGADRTGIDIDDARLLRSVAALVGRVSTRRGFESKFGAGRLELVRPSLPTAQLGYAHGKVVSARLGEAEGLVAARQMLTLAQGHLWWVLGPGEGELSLGFDEVFAAAADG